MDENAVGAEAPLDWKAFIENRRQRADFYFKSVLEGQQDWYTGKAGTQKSRYLGLAILVIVLGALISILQVWGENAWVPGTTAVLGSLVAILRSVDSLLRPAETWQAYRKASESMKREYRLYLTGADAYQDSADEDEAFRLLVSRVEAVIAEEQQLYWQFNGKNAEPQAPAEGGLPDAGGLSASDAESAEPQFATRELS